MRGILSSSSMRILGFLVLVVMIGIGFMFLVQGLERQSSYSEVVDLEPGEELWLEEPVVEDVYQDIIGMTEEEARARAEEADAPFRVVKEDGEFLIITADFRYGRINAEIEDGRVVSYQVEGAN